MLLAAATAAAPDSTSFPSSRHRLPPQPPSFLAGRRAVSSALLSRALRRCRSQSHFHCHCHSGCSNNGHTRWSIRSRSHISDHMDELPSGRGRYHHFEEIIETLQLNDGEPALLTDAESARTIVEVNNKATVMISTLIDEGVHERIILPEFPYLTDENGDIYFEVDNDDTLLESIMGDDKIAHVIIGLDNTQVFADLDLVAASATDFAQEDDDILDDEESDFDDDFDEEGVFAVDEEDGDDDNEDEAPPSWSNLETMNSCHPLYFAKMIVETTTKSNIDWLDRPLASLVVEGRVRPAFPEESTMVARKIKKGEWGTFFKVEIMSIELITAYGTEPKVNIGEYQKARPDIIAHFAPNIISRLRAGGDKITQALKSLCWRCKAIEVEVQFLHIAHGHSFNNEPYRREVLNHCAGYIFARRSTHWCDCLGFDLRVCSGTQVQTLRFAFPTKATSEFGVEKQIHELLFPRVHQEGQPPQAR